MRRRRRPPSYLRHLRRVNELSLDMLAAETGIDVSRLSRGERRLIGFSDAQLTILAEYFKVAKDDLLRDAPKVGVAA